MKKVTLFGLAMLAGASVLMTGCSLGGGLNVSMISEDEAKTAAQEFINTALLAPGTTATIDTIEQEGSLYKMDITLSNGTKIVSYISGDGKQFFPQVMDIAETAAQKANAAATDAAAAEAAAAAMVKSDKPVVEAFVMSHCPFGTQIEKGLLPVMKLLGDKADIQIKFVNYAMHADKEVWEQANQYCIAEEQNEKFIPYLECFLGSDGSETAGAGCMTDTGVDTAQIATCVAAADEEFQFTENLANKEGRFPKFLTHDAENIAYGVQGSPTLIVNGAKANSGRDSASLLKTICAAFNEAPAECDTELSNASPSAGFGWGEAPAGTDASCG